MFHTLEIEFPVDIDETWRASVNLGEELQSVLRIQVASEAEMVWRARIDIRREGDNVVARVFSHNPDDEENPVEHIIPLFNLLGLT